VWGYVCTTYSSYDWTDDDAKVVCRELEYPPQGAQGSSKYISSRNFPFFLRRPNCNGSEEHLIDCPESEIQNIASCYYSSVVYCAGKYLAIQSHIIWVPVEKKTTLRRGTLVLGKVGVHQF
jgi:hypothetical protein